MINRHSEIFSLQKITNVLPVVSNPALHTDLGIKTVGEEATVFNKRFCIRLKNYENPLIYVIIVICYFLLFPHTLVVHNYIDCIILIVKLKIKEILSRNIFQTKNTTQRKIWIFQCISV